MGPGKGEVGVVFFFQIPYGFHRPLLDININLSEFLIGNNGGSMILWTVKPRYMTVAGRFQWHHNQLKTQSTPGFSE